MLVKIKRLDPSIPLPQYHTAKSAAFDFVVAEATSIPPKTVAYVKTGLIIEAPHGHYLQISARSSLAKKKGLLLGNGIGIIDRDFSGPEDEIALVLYNFTDTAVAIEKGERLCQGLFLSVEQVEWEEVFDIRKGSRGGLGSTGK